MAQAKVLGTGRTVAGRGDTRSRDSQDLTEMGAGARWRRTARGGFTSAPRGACWLHRTPHLLGGGTPRREVCPIPPRDALFSKGQLRGASCSGGHRMPHSPSGPPKR